MTAPTIAPCPWCHRDDRVAMRPARIKARRQVACSRCEVAGPLMVGDDQATDAWNAFCGQEPTPFVAAIMAGNTKPVEVCA